MPYRTIPVDIAKGEQFDPAFLAIAPNNRIPALVDHAPTDGGGPLTMFESGAMLLCLAEKSGQLLPTDLRGRSEVLQWLFWQMGGLGPMAGQNGHFNVYAPGPMPYAIQRYEKETARLYGVLDRRLAGREFIANGYSIADIASYPWIMPHETHRQNLDDFPPPEALVRGDPCAACHGPRVRRGEYGAAPAVDRRGTDESVRAGGSHASPVMRNLLIQGEDGFEPLGNAACCCILVASRRRCIGA